MCGETRASAAFGLRAGVAAVAGIVLSVGIALGAVAQGPLERFEALLAQLREIRTARAREWRAWDEERLSLEALRSERGRALDALGARLASIREESARIDRERADLAREAGRLRAAAEALRAEVLREARRFAGLPRGPVPEDRRRRFAEALRRIASTRDAVEALDEIGALYDEEIVFCRDPQASREVVRLDGEEREVVVLRLGPALAYYATPDGARCGRASGGEWVALPAGHAGRILRAARVVRREVAAELVELPIPVPAAGRTGPPGVAESGPPAREVHTPGRAPAKRVTPAERVTPATRSAPAEPPVPAQGPAPAIETPVQDAEAEAVLPFADLRAKVEAARAELAATRERIAGARAALHAELRERDAEIRELRRMVAEAEERNGKLLAARDDAEAEAADLRDASVRIGEALLERARAAVEGLPAWIAGEAAGDIEAKARELAAGRRAAEANARDGDGPEGGTDPRHAAGRKERKPASPVDPAALQARLAALHEAYFRYASRIALEPAEVFLADGSRRRGIQLRIGDVARLFLGEGGGPAGIIVPAAGSDALRLAAELPAREGAAIREALEGGPGERLLPLDLSGGRAIERLRMRRGIWGTLRAGGALMVPLLLLALAGAVFAVERIIALARAGRGADALARAVPELVERGEIDGAIAFCRARPGPIARVLEAGIAGRGASREALEGALSEAILHELPPIERRLSALQVFAAAAPLLGLLGTVTGMIRIFQALAAQGAGNPRILSGGISEALVTTETGLAIAIPLLLVHAYLARRVRAIGDHMERGALALANALRGEAGARNARGTRGDPDGPDERGGGRGGRGS